MPRKWKTEPYSNGIMYTLEIGSYTLRFYKHGEDAEGVWQLSEKNGPNWLCCNGKAKTKLRAVRNVYIKLGLMRHQIDEVLESLDKS